VDKRVQGVTRAPRAADPTAPTARGRGAVGASLAPAMQPAADALLRMHHVARITARARDATA